MPRRNRKGRRRNRFTDTARFPSTATTGPADYEALARSLVARGLVSASALDPSAPPKKEGSR